MQENLYSLLGVAPEATQRQLDEAFVAFSRAHGSDRDAMDAATAHHFQKVEAAYRSLSDPDTRASYDRLGGRPGAGYPHPAAPAAPAAAETPATAEVPDAEDGGPEKPDAGPAFEWSLSRAAGACLIVYGLVVLYQGHYVRYENPYGRHSGDLLNMLFRRSTHEVVTGLSASIEGAVQIVFGIILLAVPPRRRPRDPLD